MITTKRGMRNMCTRAARLACSNLSVQTLDDAFVINVWSRHQPYYISFIREEGGGDLFNVYYVPDNSTGLISPEYVGWCYLTPVLSRIDFTLDYDIALEDYPSDVLRLEHDAKSILTMLNSRKWPCVEWCSWNISEDSCFDFTSAHGHIG